MPDTLRRVTVHATRPGFSSRADLLLPAECPVAVLIPSIVDAVLEGSVPEGRGWHLSLLCGAHLDSSKSLSDNDVADGEQILLGTVRLPAPHRVIGDASGVVAAAADRADLDAGRVAPWIGLAVCAASAAALAWSGAGGTAQLWVAGLLSAAAAALAAGPAGGDAPTALGLSAVAFAAATGSLAVPGAGWAATLLLSASAGLAMSTLMLRTGCRGSAALTTVATGTGTVALVAAGGVVGAPPLPTVAVGAVVLALAALSMAPKLTVAVTGVGPSWRDTEDGRARRAHRLLTGLVAGWAVVAALGAVGAVATGTALHSADAAGTGLRSAGIAVLFAADVGVLLLLRQRTHVDPRRRLAVGASGFAALAAAAAAVVLLARGGAYWVAGAAALAGIATMCRTMSGASMTPVVRQIIQWSDHVSSAAVLPLAVWVAGGYELVRQLSLP